MPKGNSLASTYQLQIHTCMQTCEYFNFVKENVICYENISFDVHSTLASKWMLVGKELIETPSNLSY